MITELRIGNFKAFGNPQRVPIKPLTLIFGANSSGKSSLIHSLLLFRHLWQKGNPDVHQLTGLAETVDLGGFRQYVFNQDQSRKVEVAIGMKPLPGSPDCLLRVAGSSHLTVRVRIALAETKTEGRRPTVEAIEIDRGADTLARLIQTSAGILEWGNEPWDLICALHPSISDAYKASEVIMKEDAFGEAAKTIPAKYKELILQINKLKPLKALSGRKLLEAEGSGFLREVRNQYGDKSLDLLCPDSNDDPRLDVDEFLEAIGNEFSEPLVYLGPLRFYPPRHLTSATENDPAWASGGGWAWWRVFSEETLRFQLNEALKRMQIRYSLEMRQWTDARKPGDRLPELVIQDRAGRTLSARDIGVGVSQVIPVIASSLASTQAVIAVEQPEIHLHPALQAELGDVFIESALGERQNTFLLETHSEHLILRILRRIRETKAGTATGLPPIRPEHVAVLYVKPGEQGSLVTEIPVTPDGDFSEPWPEGFFEERGKELF